MLQPFPLNRNLVPRFVKGGGHKITMKDALVAKIRGYQDNQEDDRHGFPCSLSFRAWVTEPIAESSHIAFIT
jgi:hypothetical protein